VADREPQRQDDRPTGEMTDAMRSERTDHVTHDLHVLAAAADRTVDDTTRSAAERQAADCRDCAALFADLRSISAGLAELPRELAVTRDFRISPERAARLRPAGWRGLVQALFGTGPSLRPFASALTTLGIAGLLLTVGLPGLVGGFSSAAGGAAPAQERTSLSTVGQGVDSGKSNNTAVPAAPGGPPAGAAASSASRDFSTSPGAYASGTTGLTAVGKSAPPPADGGTDSVTPQTTNPAPPPAPFPVLGIVAAASLGALLLGLFLLVRSRARPFDSAG